MCWLYIVALRGAVRDAERYILRGASSNHVQFDTCFCTLIPTSLILTEFLVHLNRLGASSEGYYIQLQKQVVYVLYPNP